MPVLEENMSLVGSGAGSAPEQLTAISIATKVSIRSSNAFFCRGKFIERILIFS
tara:strand:- start:491 stop:652 length:162 start_codon:yes stop_codon:yes gene_type:complete